MTAERVIFRTYKDPYKPKCFLCLLAAFPDGEAGRGKILATPFYFDGFGTAWFEPCDEIDESYYYRSTKIVHKDNRIVPLLLNVLSRYYDADFRVCEKR